MEEMNQSTNDSAVVGATAIDQENNYSDMNELPMVVWLRGDEPYVEDFCLDADAAMEELGIKRSRLTQISGKELRVGRIRIGRYTRPVYRTEDIETYKGWTRATATHQRSSSAIKEAASKLEEHSEQISDKLGSIVESHTDEINRSIAKLNQQTEQNYIEYLKQTKNLAEDLKLRFFEHTQKNYEELRHRIDALTLAVDGLKVNIQALESLSTGIDKVQGSMGDLTQGQTSLVEQVKAFNKTVEKNDASQLNLNRDIGRALSLVIQFLREQASKQDQIITGLTPAIKNSSAVSTKPTRQRRVRRHWNARV